MSTLLRVTGLAILLLGASASRADEPPQDYADVPFQTALRAEQVRETIILSGARKGWKFRDFGAGRLIGTLLVRQHTISVDIAYSGERFSLMYRSSENMRYRDGLIHANYNVWVRELVNGFQAEIAAVAMTAPGVTQAKPAAAAPASAPQKAGLPRAGDSWTYRLAPLGPSKERAGNYTVTVVEASAAEILDRTSFFGDQAIEQRHTPRPQIAPLGWSAVFSPYLLAFSGGEPRLRSSEVENLDRRVCGVRWSCSIRARVLGKETIGVPAGSFETVRISIEQSWSSPMLSGGAVDGGREITKWYSPQVRRAVKYVSRGRPSSFLHTQFEAELLSFKLD